MMVRHALLTILCVLTGFSVSAQDVREKVELLLMDGTVAVFSSEGFSGNKKEAIENSCMAVLRQLLYHGVEDFNGGFPIVSNVQNTNMWLQNFFTGKYPAYKTYVSDVELIGDFANAPTGELHCQTNVAIKYDLLLREARTQGVLEQSTPASRQQVPTQTRQNKPQPKKSFL